MCTSNLPDDKNLKDLKQIKGVRTMVAFPSVKSNYLQCSGKYPYVILETYLSLCSSFSNLWKAFFLERHEFNQWYFVNI